MIFLLKHKKDEDFSEWYNEVVLSSGLADYGPFHGSMAIKPIAIEIWEKIKDFFDKEIKKLGHKNAYFPCLIPENFLKKEKEHFKGFVPEVFWVTHSGNKKLGEKLALRPTSETIIYYFFSKWIKSWRDLPILINQWCNVLRAEIKATKLFVRTSEFLWQEGHTAHSKKEEADKEVKTIAKIYKNLIEELLAIPTLIGEKSEKEKFAGALYTITLESLMPDGKALQLATSHNLGQNFSIPFNIKFKDKDEKEKYVWTTSWGISTRLIGAMVMVHGDDKGILIPPKIAPIKVVIIPIYYSKKQKNRIFKKCLEIKSLLERNDIEVYFDDREEYTPGWKFNEHELKGIPLRIEIGENEIKKDFVTIVRRDNGKKSLVKSKYLVKKVKLILKDVQKNIFEKAKKRMLKKIKVAKNLEELKNVVKENMMAKSGFCLSMECEEKLQKETTATIRLLVNKKVFENCLVCGKKAKKVAYISKAY